MPNYDPDFTPSGLRLINTGYISNDHRADKIGPAMDKLNANTFLLEERSQTLSQLSLNLAHVLSGSPTFSGLTTSDSLSVTSTTALGGLTTINNLQVGGLATFNSDATFKRAVYIDGLLLVQDPPAEDSSSLAPNTRWVTKKISASLESIKNLTLDDLSSFAPLANPTFTGSAKAPTLDINLPPDDRLATGLYVSRFIDKKLQSYAALDGSAEFESAKVVTPPPDALDDRIVNAFWVDEAFDLRIQTYSSQLTSISSQFDTFQTTIQSLSTSVTSLQSSTLLGQIAISAVDTIPSGWLQANGAFVSETLYPAYFQQVGHNYDISTPPAGQFQLPNWNSEITRLRTLLSLPTQAPLKALVYVGTPAE